MDVISDGELIYQIFVQLVMLYIVLLWELNMFAEMETSNGFHYLSSKNTFTIIQISFKK